MDSWKSDDSTVDGQQTTPDPNIWTWRPIETEEASKKKKKRHTCVLDVLKRLLDERTRPEGVKWSPPQQHQKEYYMNHPPGYHLFGWSSRSRTNHGRLRNFNRNTVKLRHTQLIWENRTTSMCEKKETHDTRDTHTKKKITRCCCCWATGCVGQQHTFRLMVAGVKSRKKTGRKTALPARDTHQLCLATVLLRHAKRHEKRN